MKARWGLLGVWSIPCFRRARAFCARGGWSAAAALHWRRAFFRSRPPAARRGDASRHARARRLLQRRSGASGRSEHRHSGRVVPVTIDGETYIDGGIADPLPVDVLEEMGIERIIAVNVIPPPERIRYWLDAAREQNGRENGAPATAGQLFNQRLNYLAPGNILDTMMRAINGAQTRVAEAAARGRTWCCARSPAAPSGTISRIPANTSPSAGRRPRPARRRSKPSSAPNENQKHSSRWPSRTLPRCVIGSSPACVATPRHGAAVLGALRRAFRPRRDRRRRLCGRRRICGAFHSRRRAISCPDGEIPPIRCASFVLKPDRAVLARRLPHHRQRALLRGTAAVAEDSSASFVRCCSRAPPAAARSRCHSSTPRTIIDNLRSAGARVMDICDADARDADAQSVSLRAAPRVLDRALRAARSSASSCSAPAAAR